MISPCVASPHPAIMIQAKMTAHSWIAHDFSSFNHYAYPFALPFGIPTFWKTTSNPLNPSTNKFLLILFQKICRRFVLNEPIIILYFY